MTLYFFHVRDGSDLLADPDGAEFPNIDAARHEAVVAAREMIREAARGGKLPLRHQFEIADGQGKTVLIVPFEEAITIN